MELELEKLEVYCIIGDLPRERLHRQRIELDITLETGDSAAESDDLRDAPDYAALAGKVREALSEAKCRLVERAARIAVETCLEDCHVLSARARVRKPGCIPGLGAACAVYAARKDIAAPRT